MLSRSLFDARRHDACFSFSTKDRTSFTLEAIASIGFEPGFDLLWLDGSATDEGRQLPELIAPNLGALREIHTDIIGGPDVAILAGLTRMLALGYAYCGLIENDVKFSDGWFAALMAVFAKGDADGLSLGAATVRGFNKRVLYWRDGYAVTMLSGAGMILFRRNAAEIMVRNYRTTTATEVTNWFLYSSGKDHRVIGETATGASTPDTRIASDMVYELVLQKHGLAVGATVPALATQLYAEQQVFSDLGGYCIAAAVRSREDDASFAQFARRLADQAPARNPARNRLPYLFFGTLACWSVFLHQALFVPHAAARLGGRWRIVCDKFTGPFAFEALEPGCTLSFPLSGELRGVFCSRTPDGGVIEVFEGDRLVGEFDSRAETTSREQYYAVFNLKPQSGAPIRLRLSDRGGTFCRISGLCFAEPQPWLPSTGSFDGAAFVGLLARQAEQGFLRFGPDGAIEPAATGGTP